MIIEMYKKAVTDLEIEWQNACITASNIGVSLDYSEEIYDIISFINDSNAVSIHQTSNEGLSGRVVRMLQILSRYEQANGIYSTIFDSLVKKLSEEILLLNQKNRG